jgi:hypothetical protein
MSQAVEKWKKRIAKYEIVERFYIEAYRSNYYPDGILRLYRVTRGSTKPRKSPFMYQSVRIKTPEELARVKPVLDFLSGKLKWEELPPLLQTLEEQLREEKAIHPEILRIVKQYPRASIGMLKAFDKVYHGKVKTIEDFDIVSEYMTTVFESLVGRQKIMIDVQLELLQKLAKEKTPEGIQRFSSLLDEYSLPQLATVTTIITDRLQRLKLFKASIQNENAYEIKGSASVHNQLAKALWIVDDSYWLLHSNEPLTNFLQKEFKSATSEERKRPDFICASNKHTLVIVEIKRPSHTVKMEDINQLQQYLATVDEFSSDFKDKNGFLIAKNISNRLRKIVDEIANVEFKSYVQLVNGCRRRYQEYLNVIEKQSR